MSKYGFRHCRSTVMNLLVMNNFILEAFKNKCKVDVIFTDFSKALDYNLHFINFYLLALPVFN